MKKFIFCVAILVGVSSAYAAKARLSGLAGIPQTLTVTETYGSMAAAPLALTLTKLDLTKLGTVTGACGPNQNYPGTIYITLGSSHPAITLTAGTQVYNLSTGDYSISATVRSETDCTALALSDMVQLVYTFGNYTVTVNEDSTVVVTKPSVSNGSWATGNVTANY